MRKYCEKVSCPASSGQINTHASVVNPISRNNMHIAFDTHSFLISSYFSNFISVIAGGSPTMKLHGMEVISGTIQPAKKSENRRRPSNDNNDNGKRCSGNHSKPGWMDKSGEAEEERGQGGWETRCAFAFFLFRDPSQHPVLTTTNAQTTNPRFSMRIMRL
jgi:hypothetical protein